MKKNKTTRKIYLVRHARPDIPQGVYYGGGTDAPLSGEGIESARALAKALGISPKHLYSSGMLRAKQTLELLFPERKDEFKVAEDLHEIIMGEWELKSFDEVVDKWAETFERKDKDFADCSCPGGESFRQLQKRAAAAFEKALEETDGDILFVLHGGVMWALLCRYFEFDINNIFFYPTSYCGLHELELNDGRMRLIRFNWAPKLV